MTRDPETPEGGCDDSRLGLRDAGEADWDRLRRWLAMPGVGGWWGNANAAEAEIRIVFETESALARIITFDGEPIGYAHAIDATHWGESLPDGIPPGTWDFDCVIAEPAFRGRGLGSKAVERMADEVFSSTFAIALCVIVPVRLESAVRAYEQAGFAWVRIVTDPLFGSSWLMLRER